MALTHKFDAVADEAKKLKEQSLKDKNAGLAFVDWNKDDQIEYLALLHGVT